jgi:NADH:ubiquinone oxidoreductase subunit E
MGKIVVEVCAGTHCVLMGSMNIIDAIHSLDELRQDMDHLCEIEVEAVPCMNLCKTGQHGPFVKVDGELIIGGESESVMAMIMDRCMDKKED